MFIAKESLGCMYGISIGTNDFNTTMFTILCPILTTFAVLKLYAKMFNSIYMNSMRQVLASSSDGPRSHRHVGGG